MFGSGSFASFLVADDISQSRRPFRVIEAPDCGSSRYADGAPRFRYALPRSAFYAISAAATVRGALPRSAFNKIQANPGKSRFIMKRLKVLGCRRPGEIQANPTKSGFIVICFVRFDDVGIGFGRLVGVGRNVPALRRY